MRGVACNIDYNNLDTRNIHYNFVTTIFSRDCRTTRKSLVLKGQSRYSRMKKSESIYHE